MELQKYEVFLRAVDCGNLTQAAEELGYSQSGVSHMMKSLEEECGVTLLARSRSGVKLTKAGQQLLPDIRALVRSGRGLADNLQALNGLQTGSITIGAFESIAIKWLPKVIKAFHEDFPKISISIIEGADTELEEMLLDKRLDMAFFSWQKHMHFDWLPLKDDPIFAVLPPDHPSAEKDSFPVADIGSEELVVSALGREYDINRVLSEQKVQPKRLFSTMEDFSAVAMVECGLCISLIPGLILRCMPSKVAVLELDPPQRRHLGILAESFQLLSPAGKMFLKYAERIIPEL